MNVKNFDLSYYKNSANGFHIQRVSNPTEARLPHSHEYFQIYYVERGRLTHCLNGFESTLTRGDAFIIPPHEVHHIFTDDDTVFYSYSFMEDFIIGSAERNNLVLSFFSMISSGDGVRIKINLPDDEILFAEAIMENICREFHKKPFGYEDTVRAYTVLLITLLARNYMKNSVKTCSELGNVRDTVLTAIKYIEVNFVESLSLDELVDKLAVSKSAFCKCFVEITGKTYNQFVNSKRIALAQKYLKSGYRATAIWGLVGYKDPSTFYRNFVKLVGVTPHRFAKSRNLDKMQ